MEARNLTEETARASCRTCRFAHQQERQRDAKGAVDLSQPALFQCRRFPPALVLPNGQGGVSPSFPIMLADHWCGEYQSAPARLD